MNYTDIIAGLRATYQGPLDGKTYFLSKSEAGDFGIGGNKAFSYYKGMFAFLVDENAFFVWDERLEDDTRQGLLEFDFIYPPAIVSNGIDYSEKPYNFFSAIPDQDAQFTDEEYNDILDLIFKKSIIIFSVAPASGEKGVATALQVNLNIQSKDDVYVSASISPGIGNVLSSVDSGTVSFSGGTVVDSKSFTLNVGYERREIPLTENKTISYNAYVPQFAGVSNLEDITTYAQMSSSFQKFVQSSPSLVKKSSPSAEYIWFVSFKNNAIVYDQNNFQQSVGNWGDGNSEFYKKEIDITLANGFTNQTVYLYRSRGVKTLIDFTYKIQ